MRKKDITARHFRGITTVEDVKGRCVVDEMTGCWHWKGSFHKDPKGNRTPMLWVFDSPRGKFRNMSGPIAVLEISGKRTPEIEMGWRDCRCDDCLNPAHIRGGTRTDFGLWIRMYGLWKNNPARAAAGRRAARARTEITPEIIERVKAAPTTSEAARQEGITQSHASKIRRGRIWASGAVPGSSVFNLGAR